MALSPGTRLGPYEVSATIIGSFVTLRMKFQSVMA